MKFVKKGPITWAAAASMGCNYRDALESEFKGHEFNVNDRGLVEWIADPIREQEILDKLGALDLHDLRLKGFDINDPEIHELFKCMGMGLSDFYEMFYWRINNKNAHNYRGRNYEETNKCVKL